MSWNWEGSNYATKYRVFGCSFVSCVTTEWSPYMKKEGEKVHSWVNMRCKKNELSLLSFQFSTLSRLETWTFKHKNLQNVKSLDKLSTRERETNWISSNLTLFPPLCTCRSMSWKLITRPRYDRLSLNIDRKKVHVLFHSRSSSTAHCMVEAVITEARHITENCSTV